MKCKLNLDVCKCNPSGNAAGCKCRVHALERHFKERTLPVAQEAYVATVLDGTVTLLAQQQASAVVTIRLDNATIGGHITSGAVCDVTFEEVAGCYRCTGGAVVAYTCRPASGEIATAHCPSGSFTFPCTTEGSVRLMLPSQTINETCTITCAGGTTESALLGHLQRRLTDEGERYGGSLIQFLGKKTVKGTSTSTDSTTRRMRGCTGSTGFYHGLAFPIAKPCMRSRPGSA